MSPPAAAAALSPAQCLLAVLLLLTVCMAAAAANADVCHAFGSVPMTAAAETVLLLETTVLHDGVM